MTTCHIHSSGPAEERVLAAIADGSWERRWVAARLGEVVVAEVPA